MKNEHCIDVNESPIGIVRLLNLILQQLSNIAFEPLPNFERTEGDASLTRRRRRGNDQDFDFFYDNNQAKSGSCGFPIALLSHYLEDEQVRELWHKKQLNDFIEFPQRMHPYKEIAKAVSDLNESRMKSSIELDDSEMDRMSRDFALPVTWSSHRKCKRRVKYKVDPRYAKHRMGDDYDFEDDGDEMHDDEEDDDNDADGDADTDADGVIRERASHAIHHRYRQSQLILRPYFACFLACMFANGYVDRVRDVTENVTRWYSDGLRINDAAVKKYVWQIMETKSADKNEYYRQLSKLMSYLRQHVHTAQQQLNQRIDLMDLNELLDLASHKNSNSYVAVSEKRCVIFIPVY